MITTRISHRTTRRVSDRTTRRIGHRTTRRSRLRAAHVVGVAALVCLTACGGAAARPGAGTWPSPRASSGATAPSPPAAVPTFAATPTAQVRAALGAWMDAVGNPDTDAITAATKPVASDIQRLDFADLSQQCTRMAQVVTTLQHHRPAPDAAAENHWSKALADLHLAATTCISSADRQDMTGLQGTSNAMQASEVEFDAFSTRISQFGP